MTFEDCKKEVAKKHGLGSTLVTGHLAKYWQEAAELYSKSRLERMEKALDDQLNGFGNWFLQRQVRIQSSNHVAELVMEYLASDYYKRVESALSERSKG
jgi:hypothetical protein